MTVEQQKQLSSQDLIEWLDGYREFSEEIGQWDWSDEQALVQLTALVRAPAPPCESCEGSGEQFHEHDPAATINCRVCRGTGRASKPPKSAHLDRWLHHDDKCQSENNSQHVGALPCDCGLDAALAAAPQAPPESGRPNILQELSYMLENGKECESLWTMRGVIIDALELIHRQPAAHAQAADTHSFKVGDRVLPLNSLYRPYPVATVTEITERGFRYRYDKPIHLGARIGWYQEGEALDPDHWDFAAETPTK